MMKRLLLLACLLLPLSALANFEIADLMKELASFKGGRAKFVEKKYIAQLDSPVVSTGEMHYVAPDYLEKLVLTPKRERMMLDREMLSIEFGSRKLSIHLSSQPEAQAFVDSIRGTLAGDRAALERNYRLLLIGTRERWTLTLLPSEQKIAALVLRIRVSGWHGEVHRIEYLQADGDRAVLDIEPIKNTP